MTYLARSKRLLSKNSLYSAAWVAILSLFIFNSFSVLSLSSCLRLIGILILTLGFGKTLTGLIMGGQRTLPLNAGLYLLIGSVSIAFTWVYFLETLPLLVLYVIASLYGLNRIFFETFILTSWEMNKEQILKWLHSELSLSFALFLGAIWTWQRWNPVYLNGTWRYQTDVLYIESLSRSFAVNGFDHTLLSSEDNLRYHWISYSFAGFLAHFADLPSFFAINWFLPTLIYFTISKAVDAYPAIWRSNSAESKQFCLFLLVVGIGFEIPTWLPPMSLSTLFSLPILLFLVLFIASFFIERQFSKRNAAMVFLLFYALVGSKGSAALVLLLSVSVLPILAFLKYKTFTCIYIFKDIGLWFRVFTTLALSFLLGWYTFFAGDNRNRPLELGLSLNAASLIPLCILLFWTICDTTFTSINSILAFSLLSSGSLLSLFTRHSSGNELWFLYAAVPTSLILALSPNKLNRIKKVVSKPLNLLMLALVSFPIANFWIFLENAEGLHSKVLRSILELLIPTCAIGMTMLSRSKFFIGKLISFHAAEASIFMLSTLLIASSINVIASFWTGPIYAKSKNEYGYGQSNQLGLGAVTKSEFLTRDWIANNIKTDALFITNRSCLDAADSLPECQDIWASASAFSRRNFLIDGGGYVAKTFGANRQLTNEERLVITFFSSPTKKLATKLTLKGVRYIWLDKRSPFSPTIYHYSTVLFSSAYLEILELDPRDM